MRGFQSGNPALKESYFRDAAVGNNRAMTVTGTVNKTGLLLVICVATAAWSWFRPASTGLIALGAVGGLVLALVTAFKREWSPVTAPLYAVCEGLFLGALSSLYELQYPGIVQNAVSLTFGTLFALLLAYRMGFIRVTDKFRRGVFAATGAIFLVYLASFVMGFFGVSVPFIHSAGLLGIGISLAIVVVAALNLVLDFDFIEQGAAMDAPRYMEWYGAFALMVTLVWLYLEILRLLSKLQRRN